MMKKQLPISLLLTMLLSMTGIKAYAHDFEATNADGKTIYYSWKDDLQTEVYVTFRGNSYDSFSVEYTGDIVIPETVEYCENGYWMTYSVTGIGDEAFRSCSELTSVVIPNSVMDIGWHAFAGCTGLTSVIIPNSVWNIQWFAFAGCIGLTSVIIPNCVTNIGGYTFHGCCGLTSITIPNSVTSVEEYAFSGCSSITDVYCYAENVPSTNSNAFEKSNIGSATLHVPEASIETYKSSALWSGFKNIVAISPIITFADINVKALCVDNWDTNGDGELSEEEAASVTSLGYVFKGNRNITSFEELRYFTGLTSINANAFNFCTELESIVIPVNIRGIGENAFYGASLTSLTIPSKVTTIVSSAFLDCGLALNSIVVESGNQKYDSRDNCNAIIETNTNKLLLGCNNTIIPSSVTSIGNSAFSHCLQMTSVNIPEGVTSIGNWAFYNCEKLRSVDIPDLVTSIGEDAFWHCDVLTTVTIGKSVTSIGKWAFQSCNNLTSVIVKMMSPISITEGVFTNRTNATLYVPAGSKAGYEVADYWKDFKEIVEMTIEKCATPTIKYIGGKLKFECETEGVEFVYSITTPANMIDQTGNNVEMPHTNTVSVYAKKEGFLNSEIATQEIDVRGIQGDVNQDGKVTITDAVSVVNIILNNGETAAPAMETPAVEAPEVGEPK